MKKVENIEEKDYEKVIDLLLDLISVLYDEDNELTLGQAYLFVDICNKLEREGIKIREFLKNK